MFIDTFLIASILASILAPFPVAATELDPRCAKASAILPGDTVRATGSASREPECFRLEIPAGGVLLLDVAVPASAVEPRLGVLACGSDAGDLVVVD